MAGEYIAKGKSITALYDTAKAKDDSPFGGGIPGGYGIGCIKCPGIYPPGPGGAIPGIIGWPG